MNLLRKFGTWLWNSKERLVLAIMVVVLCYRVYMVVFPPEIEAPTKLIQPPKSKLSQEEIQGIEGLPQPPAPPPILPPVDWRPLWRDPLWSWNMQRGQVMSADSDAGEEQIQLLNIQAAGDTLTARIQVGRSKKWYKQGEKFFTFTLISIDKDTNCCAVYSEARARPIEICIEEK